jgi:hypothetical protein
MPTVLDSFVVEFGLDPAKFSSGQAAVMASLKQTVEASRAAGAQVESQQKRIFEFFSDMKRLAIEATGIFLGGMGTKEFITNITNLDAATARFAKTMDMTTEDLSAWENVWKQFGGSKEGAVQTMQTLSTEMQKFVAGIPSENFLALTTRLNVNPRNAAGGLKDPGEFFLEIVAAINKLDPAQARLMMSLMGMDQAATNVALAGADNLKQRITDVKALGVTTAESAAAAQRYQEATERLDTASANLGRTLTVMLEPALTKVAQTLTKFSSGDFSDVPRWFEALPFYFDVVSGGRIHRGLGKTDEQWNKEFLDFWQNKKAGAAAPSSGGGGDNWTNFLSGLSYLETSQTGAPNSTSSARGYFQFLSGTANKAMGAGIKNPQSGSYADQAGATRQFIETFYPGAAAAIASGDFAKAAQILKGEWPSLPGGSQPQSSDRYKTWMDELHGGGPRPPIGAGAAAQHSSYNTNSSSNRTTTIEVGEINIHTPATDAKGIAGDIDAALRRQASLGSWNQGLV